MKTSQQPSQLIEPHSLTRHAGINLQVNGEGRGRHTPRRRRILQQIKLPGFPHHRRQALLDDRLGLPTKNPGHQQNARPRTDRAHRGSLCGAGYPQPRGSRVGQQRRARQHVVAIGIGFDHRHEVGVRSCLAAQLFVVVQQPMEGDFSPQGSVLHVLG
jgi:hypothetical protein